MSPDRFALSTLKPTSQEFEQLAASLSPPARAMLAEPRSAEQRERLLQSWVRAAIDSRVRPEISRDELCDSSTNT